MSGENAIDLGRGLVLAPATKDDFAKLNADMRDDDRAECRVFGMDGESIDGWMGAWSVTLNGELIGITGWTLFADTTPLSRRALILMMTTNAVWRHRTDYARRAKEVLAAVEAAMPPWIDETYSLPMSSYERSIKWQTRFLGFERLYETSINGVSHTVLRRIRNKGKAVQI